MYNYEEIVGVVKKTFPEIYNCREVKESLYDESITEDDSPYIFFPVFWKLLELALTGKIEDNGLTSRIFSFMEDMANSDKMVCDLMAIEMLEPLFGLDYDIYNKVTKRYLLPATLKLHQNQLPFFRAPMPK